jgi:hypothetical protein
MEFISGFRGEFVALFHAERLPLLFKLGLELRIHMDPLYLFGFRYPTGTCGIRFPIFSGTVVFIFIDLSTFVIDILIIEGDALVFIELGVC